MPQTRRKFYAVSKGKQVGIYTTWNQAAKQVLGVKPSAQAAYPTLQDAITAMQRVGIPNPPIFDETDELITTTPSTNSKHRRRSQSLSAPRQQSVEPTMSTALSDLAVDLAGTVFMRMDAEELGTSTTDLTKLTTKTIETVGENNIQTEQKTSTTRKINPPPSSKTIVAIENDCGNPLTDQGTAETKTATHRPAETSVQHVPSNVTDKSGEKPASMLHDPDVTFPKFYLMTNGSSSMPSEAPPLSQSPLPLHATNGLQGGGSKPFDVAQDPTTSCLSEANASDISNTNLAMASDHSQIPAVPAPSIVKTSGITNIKLDYQPDEEVTTPSIQQQLDEARSTICHLMTSYKIMHKELQKLKTECAALREAQCNTVSDILDAENRAKNTARAIRDTLKDKLKGVEDDLKSAVADVASIRETNKAKDKPENPSPKNMPGKQIETNDLSAKSSAAKNVAKPKSPAAPERDDGNSAESPRAPLTPVGPSPSNLELNEPDSITTKSPGVNLINASEHDDGIQVPTTPSTNSNDVSHGNAATSPRVPFTPARPSPSNQEQKRLTNSLPTTILASRQINPESTTFIIGDSLLRGMKGRLMSSGHGDIVQISSVSGLTVKHLTHWLSQQSPAPQVFVATFHVGVNSCKGRHEVSCNDWACLVAEFRRAFPRARLQASSILPLRDSNELQDIIALSNANLFEVCHDTGVIFIDNDTTFFTSRGTSNYTLYKQEARDPVHVSSKGMKFLARNIKRAGMPRNEEDSENLPRRDRMQSRQQSHQQLVNNLEYGRHSSATQGNRKRPVATQTWRVQEGSWTADGLSVYGARPSGENGSNVKYQQRKSMEATTPTVYRGPRDQYLHDDQPIDETMPVAYRKPNDQYYPGRQTLNSTMPTAFRRPNNQYYQGRQTVMASMPTAFDRPNDQCYEGSQTVKATMPAALGRPINQYYHDQQKQPVKAFMPTTYGSAYNNYYQEMKPVEATMSMAYVNTNNNYHPQGQPYQYSSGFATSPSAIMSSGYSSDFYNHYRYGSSPPPPTTSQMFDYDNDFPQMP